MKVKCASPFLPLVLLALLVAPAFPPVLGAPHSPATSGGIVLIAGSVADLEWDPTYPQPFLRWELYRGTDPESLFLILDGTDQTKDHHRDSGLTPGVQYYYRLDAVYCVGGCSGPQDERTQVKLEDDVTAGFFQGWVRRRLVLDPTAYEIGFAGVSLSASVTVESGATLVAGTGTTISYPGGSAGIKLPEGQLEFDVVTLDNVTITFGDHYDEESRGLGWVQDCTFIDAGVSVVGKSDVVIDGNQGLNYVHVSDEGQATIRDNEIPGGVEVRDDAGATVEKNQISNGNVLVSGANARADIHQNTLTLEYPNYGIKVWEGYGHVADNTLDFTGFHDGESLADSQSAAGRLSLAGSMPLADSQSPVDTASQVEQSSTVLISVSGDTSAATIERNKLTHGKIGVNWGSAVTVTENVLAGDGAAITIGCVVCGTQVQAQGLIAYNTVRDGWGFEMWGGSHMIPVQYNCIQGNDPGMMLQDAGLADNVIATHNWWGSPSGPTHPSYPKGKGDRIEGHKVVFEPIDDQPTYCRDTPPPRPEPQPAALTLEADPEALSPDGEDQSQISAEVLDDEGDPAGGVDVSFRILPDQHDEQLGTLMDQTCTTDNDGRCQVTYVAPDAKDVFKHGNGAEEVTIEAELQEGALSGLRAAAPSGVIGKTTITFKYLTVVSTSPAHGARNVDWTHDGPWAVFDRSIDHSMASVNETTFETSSSHYYETGLPGEFDTSLSIRAFYKIDLSDLNQHPHADDGLVISVVLKGGPNGIKGADGSLMRKDYSWKYFTTPTLSPRVIASQGGESTNLLAGRPGVIRVEAGLGEDTELDYVDAGIYVSYGTSGAETRASHRFYPDPLGGPLEAKLTGNSANFHSRKGEVPILPDGRGTHLVRAEVTPVDQQGITIPREYVGSSTLRMRLAQPDYVPFQANIHPIAPTGVTCMDYFDWSTGQTIAGLAKTPVVRGARASVEAMLPLRTPVNVHSWERAMRVLTPPKFVRCKFIVPVLLNSYKYRGRLDTDAALLIVPSQWLLKYNGGDRIFHDSVNNTCIAADDAPAETLAHCLGHVYASGDDVVEPVRGYDMARDRYVDTEHDVTGYSVGLMDRNLAQEASASERVWIGTYTYGRMMEAFSAATSVAQSRSLAADQSLVVPSRRPVAEGGVPPIPMAVGGLIISETTVVSGVLDLIDWPATGPSLPAPEGTEAYELRLRDSGGDFLASHFISPAFGTLWDGTPYASFLYGVDAPGETHTVDLLHGVELLDTISASAHAPTVTITQPTGGTYSGTLDLQWEASDDDSEDTLHYYVYLSDDDGATWTPLSLGTTAISLTLESTEHPNGALCRCKIVVSDDFHSATALSAPFAISNPSQVDWVWPAEGSTTAGPYTQISAGFRDAMDGATIDAGTFTLVDSSASPVTGTVTYEEAARQAIFTPADALVHGRAYTATLDASIEAEDGQSLGTAVSWSFHIERGPFGVMLPLVLNG